MGLYNERVLPRLIEFCCGGSGYDRWRQKATAGLYGTVVEIGFGSGVNLPHLPSEVEQLYAVEPALVARRRAASRVSGSKVKVEWAGLDGRTIDLPDESCDAALSTFTLCTVEEPDVVMSELRRVLRPGGRLHLLEHGLAPDASVEVWQRRFEPMQRRLFDGCHLTRDPVALAEDAGWQVETVSRRYAKGPRPWSYFTVAVATRP